MKHTSNYLILLPSLIRKLLVKKNIQDIEPKFIGIGLTFGVVFGAAMNNVGLGISLGLAVGTGIGFFKSKTS